MRACAKKYWVLKFVTVVTIVCIVCPAAIADDANKPVQRAPFEQRMQKRISVDFRNTPIEDVIRIMADQADVDIVKSPAVTGAVTVTLTNVPLEEALNQILAAHGYAYVLSQNMIRVITAAEKTKETETPEVLVTRTYEIVYADITEVVKALDKFKSKQGMVSSIQGTSHIIVSDTESKIREITTFIEKVDQMTPQILVEARIYDITSKDKLDLGIEWNAGRDTTYYTGTDPVVPPGTMGNLKTGDTEPFTTGIFHGDTKKISSTTGVLKFGWLKDGVDIDAIIKAQQENIDIKLLANPRILVLDNEKASINIISAYTETQK